MSKTLRNRKYKKNGSRLMAWHQKHKNDAKYRAARREGSRRHLEQLYRDAELGRMTRKFIAGIGDVLAGLTSLRDAVDGNGKREHKTGENHERD